MMTFGQFLVEMEKRLVLFGIEAAKAKKGGGTKQSGGDRASPTRMMARPNLKVVNPASIYDGMPVTARFDKPPSNVVAKR